MMGTFSANFSWHNMPDLHEEHGLKLFRKFRTYCRKAMSHERHIHSSCPDFVIRCSGAKAYCTSGFAILYLRGWNLIASDLSLEI